MAQRVFGARLARLDDGPRMGHAGRQAHQHRNPEPFREVEGGLRHVVCLLLVRRLEGRHEGEFPVEA